MTAKKVPSIVKAPSPTMAKPGMVIVKKVIKGPPIIQKPVAVKPIAKSAPVKMITKGQAPKVVAKTVSTPKAVASKVAVKPATKKVVSKPAVKRPVAKTAVKVQPKKPVAVAAKTIVKPEVKKPTDIKPLVKPTPVAKVTSTKVSLNSLIPNTPSTKAVDNGKPTGKISFSDLMTNMTASLANGNITGQAR